MITNAVLALALSSSPTYHPPPLAVADEYTTQDGHRTRWASVTYTLPNGQTAEVVLVADDAARGDGYLFVDGEAIVHSSYDDKSDVHSWTSSAPGADALAEAALVGLAGEAGHELLDTFTDGPQEFPCSQWGKKVLRASKYIWVGVVASSAGVYCD